MSEFKFNVGDRVVIVAYPDDSVEIGWTGTILNFDGRYWRASIDQHEIENDSYGILFEPQELELLEVPYDPTQAGDQEDDI